MDDYPLVVPAHDLASLIEELIRRNLLFPLKSIHNVVVELEKSTLKPRHDQVLVVARIPYQGPSLRISREVIVVRIVLLHE